MRINISQSIRPQLLVTITSSVCLRCLRLTTKEADLVLYMHVHFNYKIFAPWSCKMKYYAAWLLRADQESQAADIQASVCTQRLLLHADCP